MTAKSERWALVGIAFAAVASRLVWLGSLSFAGDEETTTLATLALLDGWPPTLPGGLVYLRGLPFTFLEAGVVALVGVSEGALRLVPALLAGPRIVAAWWLARPLLGSHLALAAAGVLALAPLDVEYSRIARMYSLFVTLDLLFVAAVVHAALGARRSGLATVCGVGAVTTHILAVTHAPLAWLAACGRGLSWRNRARLLGVGTAVFTAYLGMTRIFHVTYAGAGAIPARPPRPPGPLAKHAANLAAVLNAPGAAFLIGLCAVAAVILTIRGIRCLEGSLARLTAGMAVLGCIAASPAIGGFLFLGVLVLEGIPLAQLPRRAGSLLMAGLVAAVGWGTATIVAHAGSGKETEFAARLLLGYPAPNWFEPALAAPVFFGLAVLGLIVATDYGARAERSGAWLALLAAAVGPMLLGGLVARTEALRFHLHTMAPLIVLALLAADLLARRMFHSRRLALAAATILVALSLRPDQSLRAVLREHGPVREPFAVGKVAPDHRGPAAFVRAHAAPDEWIAAEDMIQQKLYIGRVDLWLRRLEDAASYLRADPNGGPPRDIYTGSRHVGDLEALRALAAAERQRVVWLITSGETEAAPRFYRTPETDATLHSWRPLAWFVGADGMTRVYRLVDGRPVAPP